MLPLLLLIPNLQMAGTGASLSICLLATVSGRYLEARLCDGAVARENMLQQISKHAECSRCPEAAPAFDT